MAKGFASPKATVIIGDGFEYLKQHTNEFDVIITDSSDPDGKFIWQKLILLNFFLLIFRSGSSSIRRIILFIDESST